MAMRKLAEAEDADNQGELKRRIGDTVVYGQVVSLIKTAGSI